MTDNIFQDGGVIWITGLSGAGKSTIATIIADNLRNQGLPVVLLDGDRLREVFNSTTSSSTNHGTEARKALAFQYAHLCNVIAAQGITVVIATISLFTAVHKWSRKNTPSYFEAYLKVPMEELYKRDPKGIYSKYDAGLLTNVAGLDVNIEEPETPDWQMEFNPSKSAQDVASDLLDAWKARS
jgi:adenylylsulfate kinase